MLAMYNHMHGYPCILFLDKSHVAQAALESRIQYAARGDLGLLIYGCHLLSATITNAHHHTQLLLFLDKVFQYSLELEIL